MPDSVIARLIERLGTPQPQPVITPFFDPPSFTFSYVVHDPETRRAAIIDSVLDFDPASGRTSAAPAEAIAGHVESHRLEVDWLLETHAHADHLSAAPWLQARVGGQIGIGREIVAVQQCFGALYNAGPAFRRDGTDFDRLFADGDVFQVGRMEATVLHVPGHTPACVAYVIGNAAFVGDTMFMPDYGTARADFPGGDARQLYRSVRRLLALPDTTRLCMCHDYLAPGREDYRWQTTVAAQRRDNIHAHDGVDEQSFVTMRETRDATLDVPRLLLPAIQVNMRAGRLPSPESNGIRYLKLPLDSL